MSLQIFRNECLNEWLLSIVRFIFFFCINLIRLVFCFLLFFITNYVLNILLIEVEGTIIIAINSELISSLILFQCWFILTVNISSTMWKFIVLGLLNSTNSSHIRLSQPWISKPIELNKKNLIICIRNVDNENVEPFLVTICALFIPHQNTRKTRMMRF